VVICLRHVVKLVETLFDSGARLVVLGRFHCSQRGDVRTAGMDFTKEPKAVYWNSKRDQRRRDALPDLASGALDPCSQAGGNGVAAARRGETAFASGCTQNLHHHPIPS
jgi:hypothetical protein